jgi:hypothetical protein
MWELSSQATIQLVIASQAYERMGRSGSANHNERFRMVQMTRMTKTKPVTVFRVFDRSGQPIGDVVQPRLDLLVGRGAGTVLLVRGGAESLIASQHSLLRV